MIGHGLFLFVEEFRIPVGPGLQILVSTVHNRIALNSVYWQWVSVGDTAAEFRQKSAASEFARDPLDWRKHPGHDVLGWDENKEP